MSHLFRYFDNLNATINKNTTTPSSPNRSETAFAGRIYDAQDASPPPPVSTFSEDAMVDQRIGMLTTPADVLPGQSLQQDLTDTASLPPTGSSDMAVCQSSASCEDTLSIATVESHSDLSDAMVTMLRQKSDESLLTTLGEDPPRPRTLSQLSVTDRLHVLPQTNSASSLYAPGAFRAFPAGFDPSDDDMTTTHTVVSQGSNSTNALDDTTLTHTVVSQGSNFSNLIMTAIVNPVRNQGSGDASVGTKENKRLIIALGSVIFLSVMLIVGVVVGVVVGTMGPSNTEASRDRDTSLANNRCELQYDTTILSERFNALTDFFGSSNPQTPQREAICWLADHDELGIDPQSPLEARYALAVLYYATLRPSSLLSSTNWMTNQSHCSWLGVMCAGEVVVGLELHEKRLENSLPSELALLPELSSISFATNALTGTIPSEFYDMTSLTVLQLKGNAFTGSISSQIGRLSHLWALDVYYNDLTGTIPSELGNLVSLTQLSLDMNDSLGGTVPSELGNLSQLEVLHVDNTGLVGSMPPEVCSLVDARGLNLKADCEEIECPCCSNCR